MKNNIFFALELPNLSEKLAQELCSYFFMSVSTSTAEVSETLEMNIDNKTARKLITSLKKDIMILLKDPNRLYFMRARLNEWGEIFGPLTAEELKLVEGQLMLPRYSLDNIHKGDLTEPASAEEVIAYLKKSVLCQDEAMKSLGLLAFDHWKNVQTGNETISLRKSPCLVGGAGSGKSLSLKKLKSFFEANNIACSVVSASNLVKPGIIGLSLEDVFTQLYVESSTSDAVQNAVIILDEFDKLKLDDNDIFNFSIQSQLLQFLDNDSSFLFPSANEQYSTKITINTSHILFILAGAFTGIESIIEERLVKQHGDKVKYMRKDKTLQHVTKSDFIAFGILTELANRINPIPFKQLQAEDFKDILLGSDESIIKKHALKLERDHNITLAIEDEAVSALIQGDSIREIENKISNLLEVVYIEAAKYCGKKYTITASELRNTFTSRFLYEQLFDDFLSFGQSVPNFKLVSVKYKSSVDEIIDLYNLYKNQKKITL